MSVRRRQGVLCLLVLSLLPIRAIGAAQIASGADPNETSALEQFQELAHAALDAYHSGDCSTASKLGKKLGETWDSNSEPLKAQIPYAFSEIDTLMDGFIALLPTGCMGDISQRRVAIDNAYSKYVEMVERARRSSYGTTLGGDPNVPMEKTSTGLYYLVVKHGAGRIPADGELVLVRLVCLTSTGTEFCRTKTAPRAIRLTKEALPPGFFEGLHLLHQGDSAVLIVPPALAYGDHSAFAGQVPPDSSVLFFVDVVDIKSKSTPQMLREAIEEKGIDFAVQQFHEEQRQGFPNSYFSESGMNELGYSLLKKGDLASAIVILKLNVEAFPQSANVYDSLGEAYAKRGDRQQAIDEYRKALAIDPKMERSRKALKDLGVE